MERILNQHMLFVCISNQILLLEMILMILVGLITYILLLIQSLVGFTQYFTPSLYGDISTAKSIYKYHRLSGYLVLLLMLATIAAATWTPFNVNALHIKSWAVIVCAVLLLIGIIPRIKKQKLGLGPSRY